MLASLNVRDIVLIEHLNLTFGAGLGVLTGETGAGKSILLDALSLALGARGDASLVREGQPHGDVKAVFELPCAHQVSTVLHDLGVPFEGTLVLRRQQMSDGRTKAFINDEPVGLAALQRVGRLLVEIHGQHDERALMDPDGHRVVLDAFGVDRDQLMAVREAYAQVQRLTTEVQVERDRLAVLKADEEWLRHAVDEISTFAPEVGEELSLAERRTLLQQAGKLHEELSEIYDGLAGAASPVPHISALMRRLARREGQLPALEAALKALDQALLSLDHADAGLREIIAQLPTDGHELERVEERLFALRALARKHQVSADALGETLAVYTQKLAALEHSDATLSRLDAALTAAHALYAREAAELSLQRHASAERLAARVMQELPPLKLGQAVFSVEVTTDKTRVSEEGYDAVAFVVQTNPGSRPGPLHKVASGGELSRFLLALKVVIAERSSAPTLIFDEIDTGVGGAVADAMGERLQRLGTQLQVLAITHAPQVASKAQQHYVIAKSVMAGQTRTQVRLVEDDERLEEVARMLSAAEVTPEARAAASQLLKTGSLL